MVNSGAIIIRPDVANVEPVRGLMASASASVLVRPELDSWLGLTKTL